jgi:hypothetical protein
MLVIERHLERLGAELEALGGPPPAPPALAVGDVFLARNGEIVHITRVNAKSYSTVSLRYGWTRAISKSDVRTIIAQGEEAKVYMQEHQAAKEAREKE